MDNIRYLRDIILVIALLATILSACAPSPTPEEPTVITFAVPEFVIFFTRSNFEELAEAFNRANPDLEVQIRTVTTQEAMGVDDPFSDIMLDEEWGIDAFFAYGGRNFTKRLAESDQILNVQPLLEADPGWELDDFYPSVLGQFRHDGNLWGVPTEFVPLVAFYNRELFDEAGVAYPEPGWTRDDFLTTARALKEGLPEETFPFVGMAEAAVPFIYARGGSLVDEDGNCTLDDPLTIQALRWYLDLALVHEVMPTLSQAEAYEPDLPPNASTVTIVSGDVSEAERRIGKAEGRLSTAAHWGDAGMWIAPLWEQGEYWRFHWGVVPLPRDAVEVTLFDAFGCYVTGHSQHPQEALRWIEYLTRHRVRIFGIPARRSLAQSATFRELLPEQIDEQTLDALLDQVERGKPVALKPVVMHKATHCLGDALIDVYEHGEDVETALRKAQQRLSEE